jgi:hypothetical protein
VFKAILMRLFGLSPIYEVRTVSQLTGKTLPGTLLHSGSGYRAARAAFKSAKLKAGHLVRLQAVVRLNAKMDIVAAQEAQNRITNKRLDALKEKQKAWTSVDESTPIYREPAEPAESKTWDIAASNARQSEYMHQHQDEPNFDGPDENDHECNLSGPMVYSHDVAAYQPTCSICNQINEDAA